MASSRLLPRTSTRSASSPTTSSADRHRRRTARCVSTTVQLPMSCSRATDPDPSRRHESVDELAADVPRRARRPGRPGDRLRADPQSVSRPRGVRAGRCRRLLRTRSRHRRDGRRARTRAAARRRRAVGDRQVVGRQGGPRARSRRGCDRRFGLLAGHRDAARGGNRSSSWRRRSSGWPTSPFRTSSASSPLPSR